MAAAAAASQQTIKQQLLKIAAGWPKDKIRPNHQFSDAIVKVAEGQPAWASISKSNASPDIQLAKDGQALVDALHRLASNRAQQQFPLSDITKKPPSMPKHYANLIDGLRKAERGETEPWWKGLLRFRK